MKNKNTVIIKRAYLSVTMEPANTDKANANANVIKLSTPEIDVKHGVVLSFDDVGGTVDDKV